MRFLFILLFLFSTSAGALVSVGLGGYVPFGFSSQQETDGSRNVLNFSPMLQLAKPLNISGPHFFIPKIAGVYHLGTGDNYTKTTLLLNLDYAYLIGKKFLLHAGINTIMTRLSGDGKEVTVRNGSSTAPAYQPGSAVTSYNGAINLGAEMVVSPKWSLEFESYLFGIFSSTKRDLSYALIANIFL